MHTNVLILISLSLRFFFELIQLKYFHPKLTEIFLVEVFSSRKLSMHYINCSIFVKELYVKINLLKEDSKAKCDPRKKTVWREVMDSQIVKRGKH